MTDDNSTELKYMEIVPLSNNTAHSSDIADIKPPLVQRETGSPQLVTSTDDEYVQKNDERDASVGVIDRNLMHTEEVNVKQEVETTATAHQKVAHSADKQYTCHICDKVYLRRSSLSRHEHSHSSEKPSFVCYICNQTFSQSSHLAVHLRTHSIADKPHTCNKGLSRCTRKRVHCGKQPLVCSMCDKVFSHSSILIRHERSHTGDRPFQCTLCDKAFTRSHHLTTHLLTHSDEKQFVCPVCDKSFRHSGSLVYHQQTHFVDKSYKCNLCNRVYSGFNALCTHQCVPRRQNDEVDASANLFVAM